MARQQLDYTTLVVPMSRANTYSPSDFGQVEIDLRTTFLLQMEDAREYFLNVIKPRLDRSYKLYIAYNGDRQLQIKDWQSNIFVPYTQAVVETLIPRVIDARPDFEVQGRTQDEQLKAEKQQQLCDYLWEISKMDRTMEDVVRSALVYGTGYLQAYWKKDVRLHKFLSTKDLNKKKYTWVTKEKTFYDAPFAEWVDNYSLMYDWHNTARQSKQYFFKRLVLTAPEIIRRYPAADKERLQLALNNPGGDLTDYATIRQQVKTNNVMITKGGGRYGDNRFHQGPAIGLGSEKYNVYGDPRLQMYECFEWWRPFDDIYTVMVGGSWVPLFKGGFMPIPYDFKEAPFIEFPYLKVPGEFEGYGLPMILENPQIMLNTIKNQRLDAATLAIHKMWIVNPLANINKEELVTRPFGIIYSVDPNGVREVQFGDIKASSYKEEDLLKSDMQYASGVDDASMGAGGAGSATEVRHLRESTLERVRLFVNHLGDGMSDLLRYWMDMERQFFTKEMVIRIVGTNGVESFPIIQKDDLMGNFDYAATVLPSIAGMDDVKKKQDMDLFQLLVNMPFVDPQKLTQRVLTDWQWSLDSISKSPSDQEQGMGQPGQDPNAPPQGMPPGMPPAGPQQGLPPQQGPSPMSPPPFQGQQIPSNVAESALNLLRGAGQAGMPQPGNPFQGMNAGNPSPFAQASSPIDLLSNSAMPPTAPSIPTKNTNPRGHNRGGKVNTSVSKNSTPESELLTQSINPRQ